MSSYLNVVMLIGRIGRKPEIAKTNDDKKIAKFSIATSESWRNRENNEKTEKTEWHRIVVYNNKLSEIIENYAEEGMMVFIEGKIKYEKWLDSHGIEKKTTSIIIDLNGKFMMLDRKKETEHLISSNKLPHEDSGESDLPF